MTENNYPHQPFKCQWREFVSWRHCH